MAWSAILRSIFAAAISVGVLAAVASPAQAQWPRDDRFFFLRDPFRPGIQAPFNSFPREVRPPRPAEIGPPPEPEGGTIYGSSEAADKHRATQATHYVIVIGDSLADQLAQGLADAFFEERPEIAIAKKTRGSSGLVRADFYDWPAQLPALLENEKANAIVVMLGTNDRQVLRDQAGQHEFRTDRWRELYVQRVDAMIAAARAKGVPVIVVGQPSMQNARLHADLPYINEILRERAQALGAIYVDIWDGFVNEAEAFVFMGPALDGQIRRLRMGDGVHFSRAGARKVAHYVERDLIRLFDQGPRGPVVPREGPEVAPSGRPIAGPVLPLTQPSGPVGQLAGGETPKNASADAMATRVLVEGMPTEPVGGRADDFRWPRSAVTVAPQEGSAQKLALPNATPAAPTAARAAPPASSSAASAAANETAQKSPAPLPTVITPSKNGPQIITVPEANRAR
ncbi:MAG: SGNH family hydrolase [Xanthobacteraceae bacterium]